LYHTQKFSNLNSRCDSTAGVTPLSTKPTQTDSSKIQTPFQLYTTLHIPTQFFQQLTQIIYKHASTSCALAANTQLYPHLCAVTGSNIPSMHTSKSSSISTRALHFVAAVGDSSAVPSHFARPWLECHLQQTTWVPCPAKPLQNCLVLGVPISSTPEYTSCRPNCTRYFGVAFFWSHTL